jgi:CheY-like chemotaxis protein
LIEATALDGGRCRLRFEIADSGVGMGPTAVERLFQPFEQVGDAASRVEGTGLGLVISQSLATLMGGRIEVSSLLGHGSRFWFSIECPATLFAPEPDASMPDGPATEICGYEGDPEWILVVDDNANNRHLVINMLEPLGFSLSQAVDGQETLESLEVAMPDIILMDLFMPGLSGTETVQAIRAMPGGAAPAIIMISASANESDRQQAMAAGCNGFLAKPFGFDDLTDCLGRCAGVRWRRAVPGSMAALPPGELVYPDIEDCRHLLDLARSGKLPRIAEYRRTRLGGNPALEPFLRQLDGLLSDFDGAGIICLLEARVASADTEAHHG